MISTMSDHRKIILLELGPRLVTVRYILLRRLIKKKYVCTSRGPPPLSHLHHCTEDTSEIIKETKIVINVECCQLHEIIL